MDLQSLSSLERFDSQLLELFRVSSAGEPNGGIGVSMALDELAGVPPPTHGEDLALARLASLRDALSVGASSAAGASGVRT